MVLRPLSTPLSSPGVIVSLRVLWVRRWPGLRPAGPPLSSCPSCLFSGLMSATGEHMWESGEEEVPVYAEEFS